MKLKKDAPLTSLLTLRVADAVCDLYLPESIDDIVIFSDRKPDYRVLSGGSNIVAGRVPLPVLYMGGQLGESATEDLDMHRVISYMPAGVSNGQLLKYLETNGLSGLEFLAGIPGTIGGAIAGNAAPKGDSWQGIVREIVYAQEGIVQTFEPQFAYRRLINPPEGAYIILAAKLVLQKSTPAAVKEKIADYRSRRLKIPYPSAGSFFKNPEGADPAGKLIEASGFKGLSVHDAAIFEDHANIVINRGAATAADFLMLRDIIREGVAKQTGILLETEVSFWTEG